MKKGFVYISHSMVLINYCFGIRIQNSDLVSALVLKIFK